MDRLATKSTYANLVPSSSAGPPSMSDSSHSWGSMYRHDGMLLRIMFVGLGGGSPFKLLRNADLGEGMTAGEIL